MHSLALPTIEVAEPVLPLEAHPVANGKAVGGWRSLQSRAKLGRGRGRAELCVEEEDHSSFRWPSASSKDSSRSASLVGAD